MTPLRLCTGIWRVLLVSLFCMQMLTACARTGTASVSIHGVNYTIDPVSFRVEEPGNSDNHGGSGLIDPYAAGGTMCCYDLPRKWRPGIKVRINVTRWLPKKETDRLQEVEENHVVDVPPYVDGRVGELWVLRNADGSMGVVSSDFQPDHEKWPGKVKGWPVPSLEYQRERWDLYIKLAEENVETWRKSLEQLKKSPDTESKEDWEYRAQEAAKYREGFRHSLNDIAQENRDLIARFSGSTDPQYRAWLKQHYEEALGESVLKLKKLRESRP